MKYRRECRGWKRWWNCGKLPSVRHIIFIVNRSFFCNNIHSYQFIKNIHKSRSAGNI